MCVAVPMQVVALNGMEAVAEAEGLRCQVRLDLIEAPHEGMYVLVHAGYAIASVDGDEARQTLALMHEMAALATTPELP